MSNSKKDSSPFINKTNILINNLLILGKEFLTGDNFKNTIKYIFNKTFRINDNQNFILNSNLFKSNNQQQGGNKKTLKNKTKYSKNKTKYSKNKTKSSKTKI